MEQPKTIQEKSEILFLYESNYSIPNGDPFTGEQRYDDETKHILVSDVRIKRFIRDYLEGNGEDIYVSDKTGAGKTSAKEVLKWIIQNRYKPNGEKIDTREVLKSHIDVRLFGGISTLEPSDIQEVKTEEGKKIPIVNHHVNLTGALQFSLLNPSLNKVNLRMHQNTTHFTSGEGKKQGSIGTTTVVPYALLQIHGWLNSKIAEQTGLTSSDLNKMYQALWYGTSGGGSSHSRSKVGQNSVLLLQIVYSKPNQKIYGVDKLIKIKGENGKKDEQWRSMEDFNLDFRALTGASKSDKIKEIRYYAEIESINDFFKITDSDKENGNLKNESKWKEKFKLIELDAENKEEK